MIDSRAVVDPSAEIDEGVSIGPFSVIGPKVRIGKGTVIGPHAVVQGPTTIGIDNHIFQFASVGEIPQDKKFKGEETRLEIGDRNVIREYATIHRGTAQDEGVTRVGNDGLYMAYTHIAHDCQLGDHIVMSNGASLAGHVKIDDHAILGGFTLVHQFCSIGSHIFSAMGSTIAKDVPPFLLVGGNPAKPHGINVEGLKRKGYSTEQLKALKTAYRLLYLAGLKLEDARAQLSEMSSESADVRALVDFLDRSRRSIVR